jgi:hypothetical protein
VPRTMPHVNSIVIGVDDEKKSAVILRDSPNHQEVPGIWRSTLWATTELPVNNQLPGNRAAGVTARWKRLSILVVCLERRLMCTVIHMTNSESNCAPIRAYYCAPRELSENWV